MKVRKHGAILLLLFAIGAAIPTVALGSGGEDPTGCCAYILGSLATCDAGTNGDVCFCNPIKLPGFICSVDDCQEGTCTYGGIQTYCCLSVPIQQ